MGDQSLQVLVVHGIGINTTGYADALIKGVKSQFHKELRETFHVQDDLSESLNFIPVVWDDIVGPKEAKLTDLFRSEFKKRQRKGVLQTLGLLVIAALIAGALSWFFHHFWFFLLLVGGLIYFLPRWIYQLRTTFASEFVADITSYHEKAAKDLILMRLEEKTRMLQKTSQRTPLNIISHSLGTVIASDFVWERQKPGEILNSEFILNNFFTMGSPLPLFSLQFGGPDIFNKPIAPECPTGRWINIYDLDDPIGYPLKPLNAAYDQAVKRDHEINVGIFGVAHVQYWAHNQVHQVIAKKLALDWLAVNQKLPQTELEKYYTLYDQAGTY